MRHAGIKGTAIGAGSGVLLLSGLWLGANALSHGPKHASANVHQKPVAASVQSDKGDSPPAKAPAEPVAEPPDQLFAHHSPAVVRVIARGCRFSVVGGSGFFVSKDGLLITNYHVIKDADFAHVLRDDNSTLLVEGIAAENKDADLALLKVKVTDVPFLQIGPDAPPKVGTKVYAIGNPDGFTNTLSEGLISGLRGQANHVEAIQTSAAISHGSSGGPLLMANGVVVGVTATMATDGQNLNFAVPAAQVRALIGKQRDFQTLATAGAAPQDSSQLQQFAQVWSALDKKQFSNASSLLASMVEEEDNPVYWRVSGFLQNRLNNPIQAIDAFKTALGIDSNSEPAWWGLGEAYRRAKRYIDAVEAFKCAAKVKPKDTRAYVSAGFAAEAMGDDSKAYEFFRKATEFSPDSPMLYAVMGMYQVHHKQSGAAIRLCEKALTLKPDYGYAYVCLGMAYNSAGRRPEAVAAWQKAIRCDPLSNDARYAKTLLATHK